ncbi:DNA-directed RNA polymerase subunit omega, partial [Oenococcus oeni]
MSLMYPSVDELLNKVDSRYKLIALASKRAK